MSDAIMTDHIKRLVIIDYTSYRGERSTRTILPLGQYFGNTDWHPKPQWLLAAHDYNEGVLRTFAIKDIQGWRPVNNE